MDDVIEFKSSREIVEERKRNRCNKIDKAVETVKEIKGIVDLYEKDYDGNG